MREKESEGKQEGERREKRRKRERKGDKYREAPQTHRGYESKKGTKQLQL